MKMEMFGAYNLSGNQLKNVPNLILKLLGAKEDFLAEINRQDSLQQVYVERLKIVMKETTLSKFARAYYKF